MTSSPKSWMSTWLKRRRDPNNSREPGWKCPATNATLKFWDPMYVCILQDRITSFDLTFLSSALLSLCAYVEGKENTMKKGNALSLSTIIEKLPLCDQLLTVCKMKGWDVIEGVTHSSDTHISLSSVTMYLMLIGTLYWINLPQFLFTEICSKHFWWTFCSRSKRLIE